MARAPLGKHGRDHRPPGTYGPSDPGGHDPIPILGTSISSGGGGGTFVDLVPSFADLRAYWRLGEAAAPFADTSGWTGDPSAPTNLTVSGTGSVPTTHIAGALAGGADDGAIYLNGGPGTGKYLHNASGAVNTGINTSFSIMAFVKPTTSASSWVASVYNNIVNVSGVYSGWQLAVSWFSGTPYAMIRRIFGTTFATAQAVITFDVWNFLVCTYDGANLRLYVNGGLAATTADARTDTSNPYSNVDIGVQFSDPATVVGTFLGGLDEIAVWGSVLTAGQINALYTLGIDPAGNATAGKVPTANGSGATAWDFPRIKSYVNGA